MFLSWYLVFSIRAMEYKGCFNTLNYLAFKPQEIVMHYVARFNEDSGV